MIDGYLYQLRVKSEPVATQTRRIAHVSCLTDVACITNKKKRPILLPVLVVADSAAVLSAGTSSRILLSAGARAGDAYGASRRSFCSAETVATTLHLPPGC